MAVAKCSDEPSGVLGQKRVMIECQVNDLGATLGQRHPRVSCHLRHDLPLELADLMLLLGELAVDRAAG
jgi:hypothetical protein